MMGVHAERKELFSYQVDLERRVRADHPLRAIRRTVDFGFGRQAVAHCYGCNGHVSADPEVIVKLMFLLFLDNVKSERELRRMLPERLDHLWFLGFGLDDEAPDHSVLSKARARWGGRQCSSRSSCGSCGSAWRRTWSTAQSSTSTAA
jgi:transposase